MDIPAAVRLHPVHHVVFDGWRPFRFPSGCADRSAPPSRRWPRRPSNRGTARAGRSTDIRVVHVCAGVCRRGDFPGVPAATYAHNHRPPSQTSQALATGVPTGSANHARRSRDIPSVPGEGLPATAIQTTSSFAQTSSSKATNSVITTGRTHRARGVAPPAVHRSPRELVRATSSRLPTSSPTRSTSAGSLRPGPRSRSSPVRRRTCAHRAQIRKVRGALFARRCHEQVDDEGPTPQVRASPPVFRRKPGSRCLGPAVQRVHQPVDTLTHHRWRGQHLSVLEPDGATWACRLQIVHPLSTAIAFPPAKASAVAMSGLPTASHSRQLNRRGLAPHVERFGPQPACTPAA